MEAVVILKKSREALQNRALHCNDKMEQLQLEIDNYKIELEDCINKIQNLSEAIDKLENKNESTSKSKKTK